MIFTGVKLNPLSKASHDNTSSDEMMKIDIFIFKIIFFTVEKNSCLHFHSL